MKDTNYLPRMKSVFTVPIRTHLLQYNQGRFCQQAQQSLNRTSQIKNLSMEYKMLRKKVVGGGMASCHVSFPLRRQSAEITTSLNNQHLKITRKNRMRRSRKIEKSNELKIVYPVYLCEGVHCSHAKHRVSSLLYMQRGHLLETRKGIRPLLILLNLI